jgi:hypothetical protein
LHKIPSTEIISVAQSQTREALRAVNIGSIQSFYTDKKQLELENVQLRAEINALQQIIIGLSA